jgi:hypothetical protein
MIFFSVILPIYKKNTISEVINCLNSILKQTLLPNEIIIPVECFTLLYCIETGICRKILENECVDRNYKCISKIFTISCQFLFKLFVLDLFCSFQ